jgi:UDPglucose 6-dehydrogenase/GDP-mannose 6-dehydrogenase
VRLAGTLEDAIAGADAVVVVTRWKEFQTLPALVARMPHPPLVFDGRRMLDPSSVARYDGIGL